MNEELFGLLGGDPNKIREQARMAGLLNFAASMLQASGPSRMPQSVGANIGAALPAYGQAFQGEIDSTLKNLAMTQKLQEEKRKQDAMKAFQARIAAATTMQPTQQDEAATKSNIDPMLLEGMSRQDVINLAPKTNLVTDQNATNAALRQLILQYPELGAKVAEGLRVAQPKISVQSIFDDKGREVKVRYNEDTGEYSPIGGSKAESFVQVDRGNVIELRRPSGEVIGSVAKGVAPSAPSYSMTDFGVMNTKTGEIVQPKDDKGNPIVIDQSVKASEGERLSAGFYMRMADSTQIINSPLLDSKGQPVKDKNGNVVTIADAGSKPELFAEVVGGIIPNWMGGRAIQNIATSSARQQYEQAQQNWVTANLRKESGAVIGVEEMQKEIEKYFPQVGDSKERIAQKERARRVTEEAMRRNAGRALSVAPSKNKNVTVDY